MHLRSSLFLLAASQLSTAPGQYSMGLQSGPLFFQGLWEAKKELSDMHGWTIGIQVVEGSIGEQGFRFGLDYGERRYHLRARKVNRMEDFDVTSYLLWFSTEIRWSLSKRYGLFFDLGPVIGFEVAERRVGVDYFEEAPRGAADSVVTNGIVERGFAIRDGRWRMGFSADLPIHGRWLATLGAHLCPGVGGWADGHGYATIDAHLRAGLLYRFVSKSKARRN
jgi:hypothetical protein